MIWMKKFHMINWMYYPPQSIDFGASNLLTGITGSGKSTIVDAIQILMLGEVNGNFYNKSATGNKSDRTIATYLRGAYDGGEKRAAKGFSSYLALDFFDDLRNEDFCFGIVFDLEADQDRPDYSYFIADCSFKQEWALNGRRVARSMEEFSSFAKQNRLPIHWPQTNTAYRKDLLYRLQIFDENFFSVFRTAVAYVPLNRIDDFIVHNICHIEDTIDVEKMKTAIREYQRMQQQMQEFEQKKQELSVISQTHEAYQNRLSRLQEEQYFLDRADVDILRESIAGQENLRDRQEKEHQDLLESQAEKSNEEKEVSKKHELLVTQLAQAEGPRKELEHQLGELNAKIQEVRAYGTNRLNAFRQRSAGWHRQLNGLQEAKVFLSLDWPAAERESSFFGQQQQLDLNSFANFNATRFQEHVTALNRLTEDIRRQKNQWEEEHARLLSEQQEAEERLRQLEAGKKQYMLDLLQLRAFLQRELSAQFDRPISVNILADLIDIQDPHWANAIEGYLARQKFYLFIEPDCYRAAVRLFKKYSCENACTRYNIVNTHSIRQEHPDVYSNSLARVIVTENPFARAYVDYLLGRVECVEKIEEVDGRRTAVTEDGMLYKSYSTARMEEKLWRLHFIGQSSISQQIEATRQRLAELRDILQTLKEQLRMTDPILKETEFNPDFLETLAKSASDLRGVPELDRKVDELAQKLNLLDTSFEDSLRDQKNATEKRLQEIRKELTDCATQLGERKQAIRQAKEMIETLRPRFREKSDAFEAAYRDEQEFTSSLSARYERELAQKGKAEKLKQAFIPAKGQTEQALSSLSKTFREQVQKYNGAHQDASLSDDIASDEWKVAYDAVQKVEIAQFQEKVAQARDRAEEIFRNEFINQIKRNIDNVRLEIGSLNKTLAEYTFGRVQYRFKCEPTENADLRRYYDLIMNTSLDGLSLYTFMQRDTQKEYEPLLKTLFQLISSEGTDATNRRQIEENIEKYKSFQTYLRFDLVEVDAEGKEHPLSRSMGSKSGGERQTPFYIAILASLMKTYRVNQNENSMRLVVFDEAFDKIDTSRIEECVLMLKKIGFQSIVVAPTDRAAYIAPLVERTWVVTKPDDQTSVLSAYRKDLAQ